MAKKIPEQALHAIEQVLKARQDGASVADIAEAAAGVPRRTLQYRLKYLVDEGRVVKEGEGRAAKYRMLAEPAVAAARPVAAEGEEAVPLSPASIEIRRYLSQPVAARKPVGYDRAFLDLYKPNVSAYLSPSERQRLAAGKPNLADQAAGTYAKHILNRLLIDLS
jgi:DNA-binding transcriptional ArsR family regulator